MVATTASGMPGTRKEERPSLCPKQADTAAHANATQKALHIETEVHDVTVLHDVLLSFHAELSRFPDSQF